MKTRRYWFVLSFFILVQSSMYAQKGTVSAGGDVSGSAGSVSFSIGQIDYLAPESSGGKVNQGLQVPYEIVVETGLNELGITVQAQVYPNPTDNDVYLQVEDWLNGELSFDLFELQGKLLSSAQITQKKTVLRLHDYSASVYLLLVRKDNKNLKTFRIIKK